MKKALLSILLSIAAYSGFAQNGKYIPFPSKMIVYRNIRNATTSVDQYYTDRFEIQGDTLLNGTNYSKWLTSVTEKEGASKLITKCIGGIRNDVATKKVYAYLLDSSKEELLYDFDLHVGDTLFKNKHYGFYRSLFSGQYYWLNIDTVLVSHVDSILMPHDGLYHKRFNFEAKLEYPKGSKEFSLISSDSVSVLKDGTEIKINPLVEGVGVNFDVVTLFSPFEGVYDTHIICRSINGKTIEKFDNTGGAPYISSIYCDPITVGINEEQENAPITLYPNPSSGKFKLIVNNFQHNFFEINNILGVKILGSAIVAGETEIDLSMHPAGIYFIRIYDKNGQSMTKRIIVD